MEWHEYTIGNTAPLAQSTSNDYTDTSFERLLFTLLPTLSLILLSPVYLRYYYLQPVRVHGGRSLWAKLTAAGALLAVELCILRVLRATHELHADGAVSVSAASCIAALCMLTVINAEHRRALQSSALTSVYLLVTLLSDVTRAKKYSDRAETSLLTGLAITGAALKLCLLVLLELPKRQQIIDADVRVNASEDAVSGFWSRSLGLWLQSTLFLGFRSIISIDDLGPLNPEFSSQKLSDRLSLSWRQENKRSRLCLIKAWFSAFYGDFLLVVIPKFCFSGFVFCQPLLLQRIVSYVGHDGSSTLISSGLIGACVMVFFGMAASRSIFNQMKSRMATMIRGALIPLIIKKSLALPHAVTTDSADLTLMSTDIEGIANGITLLHDIFASAIEAGLGLYLLSSTVREAFFTVASLVAGALALGTLLCTMFTSSSSSWNKTIEDRVSQTARLLSQMKSIKTVGIENAIFSRLQKSRAAELKALRTYRLLAAVMSLLCMVAFMSTHIAAFASLLPQIPFVGALSPVDAFTTSAIVTLIVYPLNDIPLKISTLEWTVASFGRIQAYLLLDESQHIPGAPSDSYISASPSSQIANEPQDNQRSVEFIGAYLSPNEKAEPVLNNVTCSVKRSQITAILGPVGSGKTTLLRSMLGEASTVFGQVRRKNCDIAYCGQKPWLRSVSIRKNIVGPNTFDPAWYEVVLNACALNHDLQQLPARDLTKVGTNGANLSGGQKHRVALARALYSRAPILLLDDIFGGLDASMAQDIHIRLFGPKGTLRRSATTVVFATHSASFIKAAHQAFVLDGSGTVTIQTEPSKLVLSSDFTARLEQSDGPSEPVRPISDSGLTPALALPEPGESEAVRQRGDVSLYMYFAASIGSWKVVLLLVCMIALVANELFPDIFVRIWLESDPSDFGYFDYYAAISVSSCLFTVGLMLYWFVGVIPKNSRKIHDTLLSCVTGSTLHFITSTDSGTILNRFGQDLTVLTNGLPRAIYRTAYYGCHLTLETWIIVSGMQYSAMALPFLAVTLYSIQSYFLRTSRQMNYLDTEAKAPLYTFFAEMANGIEHIRGFRWEQSFITEGIEALDSSQQPHYFKLAIQSWLELMVDLCNMVLALILVSITTIRKEPHTQTAVGLSMCGLATYSGNLNTAVGAWVTLETGLAGVARFRAFVRGTPSEVRGSNSSLPARWPTTGNIEFRNVSSQYSPNSRVPILDDVSLTISDGQKVGISGRSGSGKTSLLQTILRLMEYTGTILIDGVDISTIPPQQLRSRITTVSQDAIKLDGSIRENLLPYEGQLGDKTISDDIILEALDQTEMTGVVESRGGLDVPLSSMDLSEGQMQLLSLARAIIHNTCTQSRVVLLDEPTSNLDLETDNRIQAAIRDAFLDCTILIVSHRPESLWDSNVRLEVRNKGVVRIAAPQHPPQNW